MYFLTSLSLRSPLRSSVFAGSAVLFRIENLDCQLLRFALPSGEFAPLGTTDVASKRPTWPFAERSCNIQAY